LSIRNLFVKATWSYVTTRSIKNSRSRRYRESKSGGSLVRIIFAS